MKWLVLLFPLFFSLEPMAQVTDPSKIAPFDYHRDFKPILERTKNKYDTLHYLKLLNRFQKNDSTLTKAETLALMIGYTDNQFFKPYKDMLIEKEIVKLNDAEYYLDALDESKKYLQTHPLSLSTLKERSFAYYKLRRRDSARYFMALADKIMDAMIYSGKGISTQTAFFSLGLADGDYFIPNVGLSVAGRKMSKDKWGNHFYIVDAVSLEEVHKTYFFNIQHAKLKMDNEENIDEETSEEIEIRPKKKKGVPPPAKPDTIRIAAPPPIAPPVQDTGNPPVSGSDPEASPALTPADSSSHTSIGRKDP